MTERERIDRVAKALEPYVTREIVMDERRRGIAWENFKRDCKAAARDALTAARGSMGAERGTGMNRFQRAAIAAIERDDAVVYGMEIRFTSDGKQDRLPLKALDGREVNVITCHSECGMWTVPVETESKTSATEQ